MRHTVLDPQGVEVSDSSPAEIDDEGVAELAVLLAEYGVVVLPEQHIDDAQFVDFLKKIRLLDLHHRGDSGQRIRRPQRDQQRRPGYTASQHLSH